MSRESLMELELRQGVLFDLPEPSEAERRAAAERLAAGPRWRPARARDGREMHEDSLAARECHQERLAGRMLEVWEWLRAHGPATDRECRDALFGAAADMNMVRPRITDLKRLGFVRETGRRIDAATGVPVRVVEALSRPPSGGDGEGKNNSVEGQ